MEKKLGRYNESSDQGVPGDLVRAKFSQEILAREKPGFMTIHLASLDHIEHGTGPFSKESNEAVEAADQMLGELIQTALANDPGTVIAIVSDHGFIPVDHHVNLMLPFIKEGLITLKPATGAEPAEDCFMGRGFLARRRFSRSDAARSRRRSPERTRESFADEDEG